LGCSALFADGIRYMDEVFDSVVKTEDIVYGNAPDLPFWFWVESNTIDIDLEMDVYEPEGDTLENRPVIIFAHTGSFFSGHNELDDVVDLSISAAKRGYVAISISYRLGLNILSTYSGERAVYRAVQDGGAAIRYLREYPEEFGINPQQIFMWGTSAGALLALHLSYLGDNDRPDATYGGGGDPDLGCPICEGNDYVHDPKPNAIVSCWGAIGHLDWIDVDDTVPAIMFHGTADPIVPFNSGFPFTLDIALPIVYGSNLIHDRLDEVGIENELHAESGLLHEYWGTLNGNWFGGPNEYFYQIQTDAYSFLYNYLDCAQQDPLSLCLVVEGGLNEVLLQWEPNDSAASYNIYREGEFVGNIAAPAHNYLDDGTFGDDTGWGLGYDTEYCYNITVVESSGNEGVTSDEICATTLPQLQVFLDLDVSLANADIAAIASPFGDLTGDGNVDAVIMVKMVNFLAVNGYQFNFSLDPEIVDIIVPFDGTNIQFTGCIAQAMEVGMDETLATTYCESIGYSSGLQALLSSPGSSGMIMGFDINGVSSIPAGYPGDGGNEGNLLAVMVLNSDYSGIGSEVAVSISDFVVSGINPFTGGSVTLNACDADLDPFNGCFDIDSFPTPVADCAGVPGGSNIEDECGVCGGDSSSCIGNECILDDGGIGFFDCDLCCWDTLLLSWLGDGYCDSMGGCAWEGPQYDCPQLGYDCGDCNDAWDGSNSSGLCDEAPCVPSYDANGDGIVNILDVIMVVNLILGIGDLDCSIDYDNDGTVNILDLVMMVNIILEVE